MKQCITSKQLMELTAEQLEKLNKWWEPQLGDILIGDLGEKIVTETVSHKNEYGEWLKTTSCDNNGEYWPQNKKNSNPLMSIGQCIEFLNDHCNEIGLSYLNTTCDWLVEIGSHVGYNDKNHTYGGDELVDALWEAVKDVLRAKAGG